MPGVLLWGWDATNKKWVQLQVDATGRLKVAAITKIHDADNDTKVDTEESADEDHVRMDVGGVEAFDLDSDGILTLAKQSGAAGYQSSDQTIPHNTETKLTWDAEEYDIQGEFDLVNDKFTAKAAGVYFCTLVVKYRDTGWVQGKWGLGSIWKNGARIKYISLFAPANDCGVQVGVSTFVQLSVDDYIEFYTKHFNGDNRDTAGDQERTFFGIGKVA